MDTSYKFKEYSPFFPGFYVILHIKSIKNNL